MARPAMQAALRISLQLGGPRVWDLVRGGRVKILMYHGVPAKSAFEGVENHYGYNVPAALLAEHADYLRRRCQVVSLADFRAGRGLSRSRTNVVITFDDGYRNNYTQAFPVLAERGLPAVYGVPTGFVLGREPLWNDVVEHVVARTTASTVAIRLDDGEHVFETARSEERLRLYGWLLRECVRGSMARRALVLERAVAALGVPADAESVFGNPDYRPMTPEQVREMAESGLAEIASHSVSHDLLSRVPAVDKRRELRESKAALEDVTGAPCRTFCVPGGAYDREVLDEAFAAGYECVLTSDEGTAVPHRRVHCRYGIFRHHDLPRFADLVHGPVQAVIGATRRARRAARSALRAGAS